MFTHVCICLLVFASLCIGLLAHGVCFVWFFIICIVCLLWHFFCIVWHCVCLHAFLFSMTMFYLLFSVCIVCIYIYIRIYVFVVIHTLAISLYNISSSHCLLGIGSHLLVMIGSSTIVLPSLPPLDKIMARRFKTSFSTCIHTTMSHEHVQ